MDVHALRNQVLSDLLPGIIHEINNPLGALIMNLSITKEDLGAWKDGGSPPDIGMMMEAVADMETASERINNYLRALSYFCGAHFLDEPAELDAHTFLRHAMALAHNATKRVIQITLEDAPAPVALQAPPALFLLHAVLALQLLAKAEGDRQVRIAVAKTADRVQIFFYRNNLKIHQKDERMVALSSRSGVETFVRDEGLVLVMP